MSELKPCPFCGQQDALVEQLDSDASVVICQGEVDEHGACLARGPVGLQESEFEDQPGRDAAIRAWNRRPAALTDEMVDRAHAAWSTAVTLTNAGNRTAIRAALEAGLRAPQPAEWAAKGTGSASSGGKPE